MALLLSECAICNEPITDSTPLLATSGCAFPENHRLFKYCDTGLHQRCLLNWPFRHEFSEAYCRPSGGCTVANGQKWIMNVGPFMYGPHGRIALPYYVEIVLREWPMRLKAPPQDWTTFVRDKRWESKSIPEVNRDIEQLLPEFPRTTDGVLDLLVPVLATTITGHQDHRTRYISVLSLGILGTTRVARATSALHKALNDPHASVKQAARSLLGTLEG